MKDNNDNWAEEMYNTLINSVPTPLYESLDEWELFYLLGIPNEYYYQQRKQTEEDYYHEAY